MAPPTNQELNAKREEYCVAVSPERKYYRFRDTWIKRSLRPTEWQKHNGYLHVPIFNLERILNEGACLMFLAENTEVPLPKLIACFEDDGAAYLITAYVEGVGMNDLDVESQGVVAEELQRHLQALQKLTSDTWGGPGGMVVGEHRPNGDSGEADPPTGASPLPYHAEVERSTVENAPSGKARPRLLPQRSIGEQCYCRPRHAENQGHRRLGIRRLLPARI